MKKTVTMTGFILFAFIICLSVQANILAGSRLLVPEEYETIQAAINASTDGDTVLVSDGTYLENIRYFGKAIMVASHFLVDDDTSHIRNTIIDGSNPSHSDSGSVVYMIDGEDTTSVLCGLTLTGGTGTPLYYTAELVYRSGGGIFCYGITGAKIIHNRITGNRIVDDESLGGGVLYGDTGFLILEKNHIFKNHITATSGLAWGGGVEIIADNDVKVRITENIIEKDTVIANTHASGGGIDFESYGVLAEGGIIRNNIFRENYVESADSLSNGGALTCAWTLVLDIRDNIFMNNVAKSLGTNEFTEGGAILITDKDATGYGTKKIVGNRFMNNLSISTSGNARGAGIDLLYTRADIDCNYFKHNLAQGITARGGAVRLYQTAFNLQNNIIVENNASQGAAIDIAGIPQSGSENNISNNTIVDNVAKLASAAVNVMAEAEANMINSILWGNSPDQIWLTSGGSINATYNDIQGGYKCTGNIDSDPLFVSGDTLFNLSDESMCIGVGTNTGLPSFDFDGDFRPMPVGSMPDMGAQENQLAEPAGVESASISGPQKFSLKQNFPNPFNPYTSIEFTLPKPEFTKLQVFNTLGEEVAILVSRKLNQGSHTYTFDGRDLASGVYYYRIEAGNFVQTRKMIYLK